MLLKPRKLVAICDFCAAAQEQKAVQRAFVGVVQLKERKRHILRLDFDRLHRRIDVGADGKLRQAHAFRVSGGPRGENQHLHFVFSQRDIVNRFLI